MTGAHADAVEPLAPALTKSLFTGALADPAHLPELLAAFAVRRLGGRAASSVAEIRRDRPQASRAEVGTLLIARGRRAVVTEGAFVGGPVLLLVPFAFCAALLSQARIVLELAALDGRDPAHMGRAAELLVIQGVYDDEDQARLALARVGRQRTGRRGMAGVWPLVVRMARLLGLLSPDDAEAGSGPARRVLESVGAWLLVLAVFVIGLVAPLVWLPYMAVSYQKSTTRLMRRATVYYATGAGTDTRRRLGRGMWRLEPEIVAGTLRAGASVLVSVGLTVACVLAGLRLAGSHGLAVTAVLIGASTAVGLLWLWRRHRAGRVRE